MSPRPLTVCLVSQEFPPHTPWGGIATYGATIASGLRAAGHDVFVISRASTGAPRNEIFDADIAVNRVGRPIQRKRFTGRTLDRILHSRSVARAVVGLDASLRFDVIESGEANLELERLVRLPSFRRRIVIQCHGSNAFGEVPDSPLASLHRFDWKWSLRRERAVLRRAERVVAPSRATRELLIESGVDPARIHLIHHGVDVRRFHAAEIRPDRLLRVGFVGRLERRKGIDFLWRVAREIGPGAGIELHLKGAVHRGSETETLGLLREFAPFVHHHAHGALTEMPEFYRSLDVLLQPSRFESFGLTYIEAMASELLVFAGKEGGGRDIIEDGVNGFLVDPDGPVTDVVQRLVTLRSNPAAFGSMRRAARETVLRHFSLEHFIQQRLDLYHSVRQR